MFKHQIGCKTEIQNITLFKLMKSFERVMQKVYERNNKPVHTVVQYSYSMERSRVYVYGITRKEKTLSFEKMFEVCEDKLHAIFLFLSMLELVQLNYLSVLTGEGRNNFIIEFNEESGELITPAETGF